MTLNTYKLREFISGIERRSRSNSEEMRRLRAENDLLDTLRIEADWALQQINESVHQLHPEDPEDDPHD